MRFPVQDVGFTSLYKMRSKSSNSNALANTSLYIEHFLYPSQHL